MLAKGERLDADRLRQVVSYDPVTGIFRWRVSRPACRAGDQCGRISTLGYREIGVDGVLHRAHRLAWLYMTGEWPVHGVDHKNRRRDDNRWENLRLCDQSQNMGNVGLKSNNTSGHAGVTWDTDRKKWRAQIRIGGIKKNLGRFDHKEDAIAAHKAAHRAEFGEFSNE